MNRDTLTNWQDLLEHVKVEGKRDASVQRYKGLGRDECRATGGYDDESRKANSAQRSAGGSCGNRSIFTTLMGEDVENRRKFIEDNALDVKNLDV